MQPLIVTLDGPAGSGKSSVAWRLAQRLGLQFLDTGAMYRGLTAVCLQRGIDPAADAAGVAEVAKAASIRFDWDADPPRLYINDTDMTDHLRTRRVSEAVNDVARIPPVRRVMVNAQQRIAKNHPRLVSEGRDQGSVVFPDAQAKFFLEADAKVRAGRRAEQNRRCGGELVDEKVILEMIRERDHRDSTRADGPLVCPPGAVRVDTTPLELDQVVDLLEQQVRASLSDRLGCGA